MDSARPRRNTIVGAERFDREAVSKESKREGGGLPVKVEVALLRPRLLPLSAEQEAEAVVVLSELLLAEAHRSASSRNVSTHGTQGSPSRREFAAGELAREGLAA
jgi:hypothetical protein